MAEVVDLMAASAMRASDRMITRLASATEAAAKRAASTSKSLKRASTRTRERAAAAAGEDTGAWDAPAAAAAKHYERRAAMETLLLCAAAGFLLRLLLGNAGPSALLHALLAPVARAAADPAAAPMALWEWLFGSGPRAARAAGGQMYTLPPVEGAVPRLFAALLAALPSFEHSVIMTLILGAGFGAYRYGFDVLTEISGPREAEMVRAELRKRVAAVKAMLKSASNY